MKRTQQFILLFAIVATITSGCSLFKKNCDCPKFSKAQGAISGVAIGAISGGLNAADEPALTK